MSNISSIGNCYDNASRYISDEDLDILQNKINSVIDAQSLGMFPVFIVHLIVGSKMYDINMLKTRNHELPNIVKELFHKPNAKMSPEFWKLYSSSKDILTIIQILILFDSYYHKPNTSDTLGFNTVELGVDISDNNENILSKIVSISEPSPLGNGIKNNKVIKNLIIFNTISQR